MARVQFRFKSGDARTVALACDCNGWSATAHPMSKGPGDVWSIDVDLPPGRHEYKFLVDGKHWWNDPETPKVPNIWGTENSYVDVQ